MNWIILALLAAAVMGSVQIVDKIVLSRWRMTTAAYLVPLTGASLTAAAIVAVNGIPACPWPFALLAMACGGSMYAVIALFYWVMRRLDAPVAAALFYIRTVFVAVLGALVLGEVFAPRKYAGMALVLAVTAALGFVGAPRGERRHVGWSAIAMTVAASLIAAVANVATKYGTTHVDAATWFVFDRLGTIPAMLIALAPRRIREECFASIRTVGRRTFFLYFSEGFAMLGVWMMVHAVSLGPVTLVMVIFSSAPLFSTALILALNGMRPHTVPDEGTRERLAPRVALILAGLAGIYLTIGA